MPSAAEQWERYGREDPYYGVLSYHAFHRDELDAAALERFYASGEDHVSRLEDCIPIRGRALDFGCGTGRVLIALAQRCEHVTGVDVSPSMLAECQRACDQRTVSNVTLADTIPAGPFDFVHSLNVLQHVPTRQGYDLIDRMRAVRTALGLPNDADEQLSAGSRSGDPRQPRNHEDDRRVHAGALLCRPALRASSSLTRVGARSGGSKSYPLMMSASTYSGSSEMKRVTSSLLRRWPNLPSSGWSMLVATAGCTQSTGQRIGEALPLTDHARFPNFAFAPRRREITGLRAT
jgi:SAM-dependent methyltransferase